MTLRKWIAIAAVPVVLIPVMLLSPLKPILINRTASIPIGIYIRTFESIRLGSIVSLPLPESMRPYVNSISPDWGKWLATHPLLKQVVAMEGDTICRRGDGFAARGDVLARVAPYVPGKPQPPSWIGCIRLTKDEIAVFAGGMKDAFDSRYFGAVPAGLARVYRPILTWREPDREYFNEGF